MYLRSNPLAEHNAGIALSSKDIPYNTGGTGNMYQGPAGRAFVQGGGGMCQFHSFDGGNADSAYARGSYAPVSVGYNSVVAQSGSVGGGSKRRTGRGRYRNRRCKNCGCDIVTGVGGRSRSKSKSRSRSRSRSLRKNMKRCRCHRNHYTHSRQHGGSYGNAAYSVAGMGTEVGPSTTALANPAPITAYNSCGASSL
jgi:hypothetical protein